MRKEEKLKSHLCVGGPRGGRRVAVRDGSGFRVPVLDTGPLTSSDFLPDDMAVGSVSFTTYRAESFHTPQGDVEFWVPEGQTTLETFTLLLETYEHAKRMERL